MAVELSKYNGSGNATLQVESRSVHTGREDKTTTFRGLTSRGASATIVVIEKSMKVFDIDTYRLTVDSNEHQIVIHGISNAQGIRILGGINIVDQSQGVTLIDETQSNIAFEVSGSNLVAYNNDDTFGKDNQYEFQFVVNIPKNLIIANQSYHIYIAPYYKDIGFDIENEKDLWIDQEAGSAYLYVNTDGTSQTSSTSAIMTQEGTPLHFYILSNTQWTITN